MKEDMHNEKYLALLEQVRDAAMKQGRSFIDCMAEAAEKWLKSAAHIEVENEHGS